jgi:hypothetical protein
MSEQDAPIGPDVHRRLGVELFNATWGLLDRSQRTPDEDDEMIHMAHASRWHWGKVGAPVNLARGEWQISRVYAVLGRAEPSLHHARRCLAICQANGIGDFDLAFAYEALARAYALAGQQADCRDALAQAHAAGEQIAEEDDRQLFFSNLASVPACEG